MVNIWLFTGLMMECQVVKFGISEPSMVSFGFST